MAELVVVIVEGPGAGREFALAGSVVAGRDPSAPIPLDDPEASRQHASITAQEGGAVVEDLGSTNGTFVGELRITEAHTLQPGDRIRIGTTVIELREGVAAAPPPPPPAAPPPAPGPESAGAPAAPEQPPAVPAPPRAPPPRPAPGRGPAGSIHGRGLPDPSRGGLPPRRPPSLDPAGPVVA